jgi:hydrogenase maturation protein HypF
MVRAMNAGRYRIVLGGAVQGVGLRPFVYRLAQSLQLSGYVCNSTEGVVVEVEGDAERLDRFVARLDRERPPAACVTSRALSAVPPVGDADFVIAPSAAAPRETSGLLNDLATCAQCLRDVLDPANRRCGYAFTNCTACGPRFTITNGLPYDRPQTAMRAFEMCPACRAEYASPENRRFHAQPNACPACGPALSVSIDTVARSLVDGRIVALKGIGGFHLLCDARRDDLVARLRANKARDGKPLAVMMPSLPVARRYCEISEGEAAVLASPAAPIVLLRPRQASDLARGVSGRAPLVGVLLPYSPLHHLLMRACQMPVVATSGNIAGEPIAIDNDDAHRRLGPIVDLVVTHDRPIARPCDDSVVRVAEGGISMLRRARGYAPLPIHVGTDLPKTLAVGAHLKSTVAIAVGQDVIVSQHLGDLETIEARRGFERAIAELCGLYRFTPEVVVADMHPDYPSRRWADESGYPVVCVQHHEAHVAACAAENGVDEPYLGVAWDGAGYGHDGTVWGGEFFSVDRGRFTRVAHLRPFSLPGGDAAAREGWRVALAMDYEIHGRAALAERRDAGALEPMLARGINTPRSSSMGRLFDAVAFIAGVSVANGFEGESAMALEAAIDPAADGVYSLGEGLTGDWEPLVDAMRGDLRRGAAAGAIAARFHRALVAWIVRVARFCGHPAVVLSGGTFQNAFLSDACVAALAAAGHRPYVHHRVPANDGGLSLGQVALSHAAARRG